MATDKLDLSREQIYTKLKDPAFAQSHKMEGKLLSSHQMLKLIVMETELVYTYQLDEETLSEIVGEINDRQWKKLSISQKFTEEFILEHIEKIHLKECDLSLVSDKFIVNHADQLNWSMMSMNENISLDILEQFPNNVDWRYISNRDDITEEFVIRNKDRVDWYCISWKMQIPGFEEEKKKCEAWHKPKEKKTHKKVEVTDEHKELMRSLYENEVAIYQNVLDGKSMASRNSDDDPNR